MKAAEIMANYLHYTKEENHGNNIKTNIKKYMKTVEITTTISDELEENCGKKFKIETFEYM